MKPDASYAAAAILISGAITYLLRALPFLVFHDGRQMPAWISGLTSALPAAIMAILVVYCLKDVPASSAQTQLAAAAGVAATSAVHLWRRSTILSVFAGTAVYMLLLAFL